MEVEEVDLHPVDDPKNPEAWEKEISKTGKGGDYVFSNGSLLEGENIGARLWSKRVERRRK